MIFSSLLCQSSVHLMFFCATSNRRLFLFPRLFTPFWLRNTFLIDCENFDSYLCSGHEDLIAHYHFQTSFLTPFSILCLVMWIFNEEQCVPHCLLSITPQKYGDSNYLWLYCYIDTNVCHTRLLLSHLCCTPPFFFFCICFLYGTYKVFWAMKYIFHIAYLI